LFVGYGMKYKNIIAVSQIELILKSIVNELEEANRLDRYKINNGYYEGRPKDSPLVDKA